MNALIVGSDKLPILQHLPRQNFLLIDDGSMIDAVPFRARRFDVAKHHFNPLKDMDDRKVEAFISVLDAAFPQGADTLTRRYSNHYLFKELLAKPRKLDRLTAPSKDPYQRDAYEKIERLLLSPLLNRVLNGAANFSLTGTILVRLDRAALGDFNCFVLANLLISQYPGAVVIPDFGFYACPFHVSLIRQNRLIAGIHSFDEVPKMKQQLLLVETKIASRCTPADAEILAIYEGLAPNTIGHSDFIYRAIGGA